MLPAEQVYFYEIYLENEMGSVAHWYGEMRIAFALLVGEVRNISVNSV